jgi:formate dehydrogenase iron-sulfur subunit
MTEQAILFDTSRCTGCHACQVACKCWNNLPSPTGLNENKFTGTYQNPPDLNGTTRLIMTYHEEEGGSKGVKWAFGRRACQHCTSAPCASICPADALRVNEETGMVETDSSKCVACQYCSTACPFDVPRYDGVQGTINKCTGCPDRIENGMAPACVTTCQPEALNFGPRDEMLAEAEKRLANLKARGYEDAVVYGGEEMDGLHVIQVLKYGVATHGQVENPQVSPVTELTNLMKPVTGVMTGVALLGFAAMFGLGMGYKRDKMAYNPETGDTLSTDTGEVLKQGDGEDTMSVKDHIFENLPCKKGEKHE